jgi:acetylornithine deacetylase/succinyl-diaminopimelate desuccinylase-like protein
MPMTRHKTLTLLAAVLVSATFATAATAQNDPTQLPIAPEVEEAYQAILAAPVVQKALDDIRADDSRTFDEQKTITEIPAPPFKEQVRAEFYVKRLQELGLEEAHIDAEGNAIGMRKGAGSGPRLVISAHLDTVFPEGTDVQVKEKDGRFYAPGIRDDARGLAALLSLIRAMNMHDIKTVGDVVFVGTVGEEELGNLRGVKALFRDYHDIDGFISIDNPGIRRIINKATGSHRYEVKFTGPGGHSFGHFGRPSAIHAMGRAIAKIADLETPTSPKTTFTVGTVRGGISVNAIAGDAWMGIDLRSNSMEELLIVEQKVMAEIQGAVTAENKRWTSDKITVDIQLIGDRPAGTQPDDAKIVQAARRSLAALGQQVRALAAASTDANVPIALGVPAVTLHSGGEGGGVHSLDEWFKPTEAHLGPQNALLTVLGLVGLDGVSQPLLDRRGP